MLSSIHFFERPCPPGWIYPCALEDITCCLSHLPEQDLEGLWAVGLVPSTRKASKADGRYYWEPKPTIHLLSYPDTLRFKQPAHTKRSEIEKHLSVELQYGMTVEREGSRFICVWKPEDLRYFVAEHVLAHEVGHHVYFRRQRQQGIAYRPNTTEAEQFAEDYAMRWRNLMSPQPGAVIAPPIITAQEGQPVDPQDELKNKYVRTVVAYDPSRGYPHGNNLAYECPLCHSWIHSQVTGGCTCEHISVDYDMGRFSVRDRKRQPILLRLSPS